MPPTHLAPAGELAQRRRPAQPSYPLLRVSLDGLRHNTRVLVERCHRHGIQVAGVSKLFCGQPQAVRAMVQGGIDLLADSRLANLRRLRDIPLPKLLLRLPAPGEVEEVVAHSDISLNSEAETLKALASRAREQGRTHQVILMVELGDLREGIYGEAELLHVLQVASGLQGLEVSGLGANFTCYGGVIPTRAALERLVALHATARVTLGVELPVISAGNSSALHLLDTGQMPAAVNQLRLGEAIALGRETAYGQPVAGARQDCFRLLAQIVELKRKPSLPSGPSGVDAFGARPHFEDRGLRLRAICAIGKQDVMPENLIPHDKNAVILGASSDHLLVDLEDCAAAYRVGDCLTFGLTYGGVLSTISSDYVHKIYG